MFRFALLGFLTVLAHYPLFKMGMGFQDADQFFFPLAADHSYAFQEWSVFPFTQGYGGLGYSWLRILWTQAAMAFGGPDLRIPAQMAFTYGVSPILLTLSAYAMLRSYCSSRAAWITGLFAAAGYHYCANILGIDCYIILPILGASVFALRASTLNPLMELSLARLVGISIALGFGIFIFRPAAIYLVAFFVPWHALIAEAKLWWAPQKTGIYKTLKSVTIFLTGLYFYIQVFGGDFGTLFGRTIRIAGGPNLTIATIFFGLGWALRNRSQFRLAQVFRVSLVAGGLILGLLPEMIHWVHVEAQPTPIANNGAASPSLNTIIHAFYELVLGYPGRTPDTTILKNAQLLLLIASLVALFRSSVKTPRLQPFVAIIGLNLIAFVTIHMTSPGATRYLFAIYPALILATGVLMDWALSKTKAMALGMTALILASGFYQVRQHWAWAHAPETLATAHSRFEVVRHFRAMGVEQVWVDRYDHTLAHSFLSHETPVFVADDIPWPRPPHWMTQAGGQETLGVLLSHPPVSPVITALGVRYQLKEMQMLGSLYLFKGEKQH